MKTLLIFLLVFTLLAIAILHLYWVAGGTWGIDGAMPTSYKKDYFNPANSLLMKLSTLVVAIGLALFALIIVSNYFDFTSLISPYYTQLGSRIIGSIFLIRAIGDFNMFGLFKKKSDDLFTQRDSQIYIPLCLFLGIGSIAVSLI